MPITVRDIQLDGMFVFLRRRNEQSARLFPERLPSESGTLNWTMAPSVTPPHTFRAPNQQPQTGSLFTRTMGTPRPNRWLAPQVLR